MSIGGETSFWLGGETSFQNMERRETSFLIMKWVRHVLPKYDSWTKRLSEIWFGCETSFWNMVRVRNVFVKYGLGAKRLPELWRRGRNVFPIYGEGRNVFPKYELGQNVSLKMVRTDWLWVENLWTGGSSPNSDFVCVFLFFLCVFFVHVSKNKKMHRGWSDGVWPIQFFLWFFLLDETPKRVFVD